MNSTQDKIFSLIGLIGVISILLFFILMIFIPKEQRELLD